MPVGKELEVVVRSCRWGGSLGVRIPRRTVERLGIRAGDELRLLVCKVRGLASMPIEVKR